MGADKMREREWLRLQYMEEELDEIMRAAISLKDEVKKARISMVEHDKIRRAKKNKDI